MSNVRLVHSGCEVGAMLDVRLVLVWIWGWYNVGCSVGIFLDVRVVLGWMLDSISQPPQVRTAVLFQIRINFSNPIVIQNRYDSSDEGSAHRKAIPTHEIQTEHNMDMYPSPRMAIESRRRFRTVKDSWAPALHSLLDFSCMAYRGSLWGIAATECIWTSERNNKRLVRKLGHCSRPTAFPNASEESYSPTNSALLFNCLKRCTDICCGVMPSF
jgi:hypothetical protein